MRIIRQIIRGCGTLPHYGAHPGTGMVLAFALLGGIAGASRGSVIGFIGGALFMALFVVPVYLIGAYDRANESDRLERRPTKETGNG